MGAWGTGIFQDDFALDLRGLYEELLSLKFADEAILAQLQRDCAGTEGEESTFWIALALLQHKSGRLADEVKRRALQSIDSGRALRDWADLTEAGDSSIPARKKELLKARSIIVSVQPKRKSPRPSKELLERIDRTYPRFPWKEGGLYAYRLSTGEYVVLAATRVLEISLSHHYARQGDGFVPVPIPNLMQPIFLLLDYRKSRLPSRRELSAMRPFVQPIRARERKEWLELVDENHARHRADARRSFAEFERDTRECHAAKTDEQFRAHYDWWVGWNKKQCDLYADREQALQRYFSLLLMIDAKQSVPAERLIDLEMARHFDCEDEATPARWETLDHHLVSKKPLTGDKCHFWPAA